MSFRATECNALDPATAQFYRLVMELLIQAKIPFLVGGAYCLAAYAGLERHTKDFDLFVRPHDCKRVLDLFDDAGYRTELTFPHWLGKVRHDSEFIDVIFSSGNGLVAVDDGWFEHAVEATVLGMPAWLCPVEETIWSKAFVMERERFDGADIAHLLRTRGASLDWRRLLARFGPHWRMLLCHLVLFGFIYPSDRKEIPAWVMKELQGRLQAEARASPSAERVCQGTLLSRQQYLVDIECWGYQDARLRPLGNMSADEVARWTEPIVDDVATPRPAPPTVLP